jgi:hypothetical protein
MNTIYIFIIYRSVILKIRNILERSCRENQNTHFMFNNFPKLCRLWKILWEKYCRAGLATDNNMALAHCMLDTKDYEHTLRICNTYCSSTATMVARTRLIVTLYVHWLSRSKFLPSVNYLSYVDRYMEFIYWGYFLITSLGEYERKGQYSHSRTVLDSNSWHNGCYSLQRH